MFKKIVLISSIIFTGLAIIAGIYFLFFGEKSAVPQTLPAPEIIIETPTITSENIIFTSQSPYLGATLSPGGRKIRYFDPVSQSFLEADFNGANSVKLLDTNFKNVSNIIWSPDKSKIIITLNINGAKQYQFIDLKTGEKIAYPIQWRSPVFSPTSDKIAYNFLEPSKNINAIEMSDVSGKNRQEISKIRIQDVVLYWPQNEKLAVFALSSALSSSPLLLLDIPGGELIKIIPESFGLEILWSPDGNKAIFSTVNKDGQDLKLKLVDIIKKEIKDLEISTFASKCAWAINNRAIYCAVPFEWPDIKLILPDDYWRKKIFTYDHLVKIDLNTGEKTVVFSAETNPPDVENLLVDPKEEYLFFTNKKDGLFYAVSLK